MAIRFDITGDNQNFIDSMNEVRREVEKTSQMLSSIGKSINMDGVISQINEVVNKLTSEKATIEIDLSSPENQLQQFDADIAKFVENLNTYFNGLKDKLEEMASLMEIYRAYSKDGIDSTSLEAVVSKHAAITEQLNKQTEAIRQQQILFNDMLVSLQNRQTTQSTTTNLDQSFAISVNVEKTEEQKEATDNVTTSIDEGLSKLAQEEQQLRQNTEVMREQTEELRKQENYQIQIQEKENLLISENNGVKFSIVVPEGEFSERIDLQQAEKTSIEETGTAIDNVVEKIHEEKEAVNEVSEAWKGVQEAGTYSVATPNSGEEIKVWAAGAEEAEVKARILEERFLNLGSTIQQAYETMGRLANIGNLSQEEQRAIDKTEELIKSLEKVQSVSEFTGEGGEDTKIGGNAAKLEENVLQMQKMIRLRGEESQKLDEVGQKTDDVEKKEASIRTRIMEARQELVSLIEQGKGQSPQFAEAAKQAGALRREMALSTAAMQYYANPTRHIAAFKDGMQAAIGTMSVFSGVMGLVTTKSDEFAKIQKDIQTYLSLLIGLETVYNKVKLTSNTLLGIQEIQTLALARAQQLQGSATIFATVQQRIFNAVAKANPYLLLISGIGLVIGAVIALTNVFKKHKKEAEETKKKQEDLKKAMDGAASSAASDIISYEKLRSAWLKLGNDLNKKKKFIKQNQKAFHNLGISVNNVTEAENVMVNNTATVVESLKLRARAAAAAKLAEQEMEEGLKKENKLRDDWNKGEGKGQHKQFKEGQVVKKSDIDELGLVEGRDYEYVSAGGYAGSYKIKGSKNKNGTLTANAVVNRQNGREYNKQKKEIQDEAQKSAEGFVKMQQEAEQMRGLILSSANIKTYEELIDKPEKTSSGKQFDPKEAAYQQKKLQEKYNDEIEDYAKKLQQELTNNAIEIMDEGTKKELAKIEEDKKQKLAAIEKEIDDLVEKRKELDKQMWLKGGKDRKENEWAAQNTTTDEQYRQQVLAQDVLDENGKKIGTLGQMFGKQRKQIGEGAVKSEAEIGKRIISEHQSYIDKRLANEKKYNEDVTSINASIENARSRGDEAQVEALQRSLAQRTKEYGEEQINLSFEEFKKDPAYIKAFSDMDSVGTLTLQRLIKQFKDLQEASTDSFKDNPQLLRDWQETLQRMTDELDSRNPFTALKNSHKELQEKTSEYNQALEEYKSSKKKVDELAVALKKGEATIQEYNAALTELAKRERDLADAQDDYQQSQSNYNKNVEKCQSAIDNLAASIVGLGNTIGGTAGDILKLIGNTLTFATEVMSAVEQTGKKTSGALAMVEKASAILAIISAAIQLLQQLEQILPDARDEYEKLAAKQKQINDARDALYEYRQALLDTQAVEENWFSSTGLSELSNQWVKSGEAQKEYWEKLLEAQAIYQNESGHGFLTKFAHWTNPATWIEKIGIKSGAIADALALMGSAMFGLEGTLGQIGILITEKLGAGAFDYVEGTTAAINNLRIETRKASKGLLGSGIGGKSQKTEDLITWVKNNLGLNLFDSEGMIDTNVASVVLDKYGDRLVGETKETLEKLKELKEEWDKYQDDLREYISQFYSPISDSMVDSLWTWYDSGTDILDNFRDYAKNTFSQIGKEMIKQLVNEVLFDKYKEELQEIYTEYSKNRASGMEGAAAINKLSSEIMRATDVFLADAEGAIPILQAATSAVREGLGMRGLDGEYSESNGTFKSASSFTAEQGDVLNGRLTAIQISSEKRNGLLTGIIASLDTYKNINAEHNAIVSEIRSQIVQSNSYLADIALYSRNIYRSFGEKIDTLITNTQYL